MTIELFTIGHSDLLFEQFLALLREHAIALVVDARSAPRSAIVPWSNRHELGSRLRAAGVEYLYAGGALGGRPRDPALRGPSRRADYHAIEQAPGYRRAIDVLVSLAANRRLAVMCSEGNPLACHRHRLLAPSLAARGCPMTHILRDGTLLAATPPLPGLLPFHRGVREERATYTAQLSAGA